MTNNPDIHIDINEALQLCKDYAFISNSIFRLKASSEEDIEKLYQIIKNDYLDQKKISPEEFIKMISHAILYNNRYLKSYWAIFERIYNEYHIGQCYGVSAIFDYLVYQKYNVILDYNSYSYFSRFKDEDSSLDHHEDNTICKAIMNDDLKSFISFTIQDNFDSDQKHHGVFYPELKDSGYSLLELCCYYGAVNCFKFIITEFKANITHACLIFSLLGGNQEIISECLNGRIPDEFEMEYAIISHNIDFITFLKNEFQLEIEFDKCEKYNNIEAVCICLEDHGINDIFNEAVKFNQTRLCEYLISHGTDVKIADEDGITALYLATRNNNKELCEILISNGADVNAKLANNDDEIYQPPYQYLQDDVDIIIYCPNGSLNPICQAPLHQAAWNNNKEIVELLISHGADINILDKFNRTPLHYAARKNSKDVAMFLISKGTDFNLLDKHDSSPLHFAARNKHKDVAELLVSLGTKINIHDSEDNSPLYYAAKFNSEEVASFLISHGADISAKNHRNNTALLAAAEKNYNNMVKLLVSHGANINDKDNSNKLLLLLQQLIIISNWPRFLFHMVLMSMRKIRKVNLLFVTQ